MGSGAARAPTSSPARPATTPAPIPRYTTCDSVLPSHPLWVGTDALAYDLACEQGQDTAFAHLWATTVDVTDAGHTIDLSRLLEDLAGLVRKDFFDASIIPLPQSGRAGESIV